MQPPEALARALADVARQAAEQQGGRPTRCATIHLTLAFLGDVPVADLPVLVALGERLRGLRFPLRIDRLGYWPNKRLLWAGLSEVPEELRDVQRQLLAALAAAGYRTDPAGRGFAPHLTLVRRLPPDGAAALVAGGLRPLDWPCSSFALFRSDPGASGPEHTVLREFPLA